jgi:hypothetical protein
MPSAIVKYDLSGWLSARKALAGRFNTVIMRGVRSGAARCLPILHAATRNAIPANPSGVGVGAFNTGAYLRAWKSRGTDQGAVVFNDSPYAGIIEFGRRPGARMPPIDVIEHWVIRKGLAKTVQKAAGRKRSAAKKLAAAYAAARESRSIAFVIARAIKRRGLIARRVMHSSLKAMGEAVYAEISVAVHRAILGKL